MGKQYRQLTKEDRQTISALRGRGLTNPEIARQLGVSDRTIRRELTRGVVADRSYNAKDAHQKKLARRKRSKYLGMKIDQNPGLQAYIVKHLEKGQRPECIAGRLKKYHGPDSKEPLPYVSSKGIYRYLYSPQGQKYCSLLPSQRHKPRKQSENKAVRQMIPNRIPITERPAGANNRTRYGHTSSDTMVSGKKTGSKTAIAGTIERKLRYLTLAKLPNLKPQAMCQGLKRNIAGMGIQLFSMTFDNGIENKDHEQLRAEHGIQTYFCDPYSSWQKGEIEHAFKLVRAEGIPKGMDLSLISDERLQEIQDRINNRWRKSLDYASPQELMNKRRLEEQRRTVCKQKQTPYKEPYV